MGNMLPQGGQGAGRNPNQNKNSKASPPNSRKEEA